MANIEKMNRFLRNLFVFSLSVGPLFLINSCKEDDKPTPKEEPNPYDTVTVFQGLLIPSEGSIKVNVTYTFGSEPLQFDNKIYTSAAGDSFTVSLLRHYLSNLTLTGKEKSVNLGDYHLLNAEEPASCSFTINKVPAGVYDGISVIMGVDSVNNSSGLQEGALDPAWGMFWTWATGYIFIKFEGTTVSNKTFGFHMGGNKVIPLNTASMSSYKVKSQTPVLNLNVDLKAMLENPYTYDFDKDGYNSHSSTETPNDILLGNMKNMVTVKSLLAQ